MKPLKGSRTEANLMAAFAGETQARTKYTYYASQAKKDGYVQISKIFEETAANEKEHAKIWFKLLHGGAMPATTENLKDAAAGEHFECIGNLRSRHGKRGSTKLLPCLKQSERLKRHTKNAFASCLPMSRADMCSRKTAIPSGNVQIADTFTSENKLRKSVRSAIIRSRIFR